MSPLSDLEHEAVESARMGDRELLVLIYDAVREINGNVKSHTLQLKYLWAAVGFIGTAVLATLGFLLEHVL